MKTPAWHELFAGVFEWVWTTSLYASVLIVLVMLVQRCFGKLLNARLRYWLGLLVLIRLLMPVTPESKISLFNLRNAVETSRPAAVLPPDAFEAPVAGLFPAAEPVSAVTSLEKRGKSWRLQSVLQLAWGAGVLMGLTLLWRTHRRLCRQVAMARPVREGAVAAIFDECRERMSVRKSIHLVESECVTTPALFGFLKPRLLLPAGLWEEIPVADLRFIFLHELAHVRRRDVLVNWIIAVVRILHWFNPLVRWAMENLRANRELVCDAMVLERLPDADRRRYGGALIALAERMSRPPLSPALVPAISNKNEVKRRITMIARFKTPGRLALAASLVVVLVLCALTFTRDSRNTRRDADPAPDPYHSLALAASGISGDLSERIAMLEARRLEIEDSIPALQQEIARFRGQYNVMPGLNEESLGAQFRDALAMLHRMLTETRSEHFQSAALLRDITQTERSELRMVLPTLLPDAGLDALLREQAAAEQRLAALKVNFSGEHPRVESARAELSAINDRMDRRISGIIVGMQIKTSALADRIDYLRKEIESAQTRQIELAEVFHRHTELVKKLHHLTASRDIMARRIEQEQIEALLRP